MKGQQDALTAVLITGILIAIVGAVYFWGLPLIEKNKDISTLSNAEKFMSNLNEKIKFVANNGGREQIKFDLPGTLKFTDSEGIKITIDTKGTIYAVGGGITLGKNMCKKENGVWGTDDPEIICVEARDLSSKSAFSNEYTLKYITLETESIKSFRIVPVSKTTGGFRTGSGHIIIIENSGTEEKDYDGMAILSTKVTISVL